MKVPPDSSSGVILLLRVRPATSAILLGQPGDREVTGVLDHRGQQPTLGVHRERDVLAVEVGDLPGLGVEVGVELAGAP